jgi:hypothetical protein
MSRSFTGRGSGRPTGYYLNRRKNNDRRGWEPAQFPLMELNGQLMLFDRRNLADRRLNNIKFVD